MKERELRLHATCSLCKEKIGHAGVPLFWTVRIERHAIDMQAMQRQTGLAMMFGGNGALAAAMGPDEEMTTPAQEPVTLTVCNLCAVAESSAAPIAVMAALGSER